MDLAPDFSEFFALPTEHRVDFGVVGAYAASRLTRWATCSIPVLKGGAFGCPVTQVTAPGLPSNLQVISSTLPR